MATSSLPQRYTAVDRVKGDEIDIGGIQRKEFGSQHKQGSRVAKNGRGKSKESTSSSNAAKIDPNNEKPSSTRGTRKRKKTAVSDDEQSDTPDSQDDAEAVGPSEEIIPANEQAERLTCSKQAKKDTIFARPTQKVVEADKTHKASTAIVSTTIVPTAIVPTAIVPTAIRLD